MHPMSLRPMSSVPNNQSAISPSDAPPADGGAHKGETARWLGPGTGLLLALVVAAAALAVYWNNLGVDFILDDHVDVPSLPGNAHDLSWRTLLENRSTRWFHYALDEKISGGTARGYHLSNNIVHAINSALLFAVVVRLLRRREVAFLAAMIFALHPVHVEAVTIISHRKDLLATLFAFASLYCYLRKSDSIVWYLCSLPLFGLAVVSKEVAAVMLPFAFLAADVTAGAGPLRQRVRRGLPYVAVFIGAAVVALVWLGFARQLSTYFTSINARVISRGRADSFLQMVPIVPWTFCYYTRLLLVPWHYCLDHAVPLPLPWINVYWLIAGAIPAAACLACAKCPSLRRGVGFGWAYFLLIALPVLNVIPLSRHFITERYVYHPSAGMCIVLATLLAAAWPGRRRWTTIASLIGWAAVLGGLAFATVTRNHVYQSRLNLWADTLQKNPASVQAHLSLGNAYRQAGMYKEALEVANHLLMVAPHYPPAEFDRDFAQALLFADQGREADAEKIFRRLAILPEFTEQTIAAYHHAVCLRNLGRHEEALTVFERVAASDVPAISGAARYARGLIFLQKGDAARGINELELVHPASKWYVPACDLLDRLPLQPSNKAE